jgi:hypothetical protein
MLSVSVLLDSRSSWREHPRGNKNQSSYCQHIDRLSTLLQGVIAVPSVFGGTTDTMRKTEAGNCTRYRPWLDYWCRIGDTNETFQEQARDWVAVWIHRATKQSQGGISRKDTYDSKRRRTPIGPRSFICNTPSCANTWRYRYRAREQGVVSTSQCNMLVINDWELGRSSHRLDW